MKKYIIFIIFHTFVTTKIIFQQNKKLFKRIVKSRLNIITNIHVSLQECV